MVGRYTRRLCMLASLHILTSRAMFVPLLLKPPPPPPPLALDHFTTERLVGSRGKMSVAPISVSFCTSQSEPPPPPFTGAKAMAKGCGGGAMCTALHTSKLPEPVLLVQRHSHQEPSGFMFEGYNVMLDVRCKGIMMRAALTSIGCGDNLAGSQPQDV